MNTGERQACNIHEGEIYHSRRYIWTGYIWSVKSVIVVPERLDEIYDDNTHPRYDDER